MTNKYQAVCSSNLFFSTIFQVIEKDTIWYFPSTIDKFSIRNSPRMLLRGTFSGKTTTHRSSPSLNIFLNIAEDHHDQRCFAIMPSSAGHQSCSCIVTDFSNWPTFCNYLGLSQREIVFVSTSQTTWIWNIDLIWRPTIFNHPYGTGFCDSQYWH